MAMGMVTVMAMGRTKGTAASMPAFTPSPRLGQQYDKFAFGRAATICTASICLAVLAGAAAFGTIRAERPIPFAPINVNAITIRADALLAKSRQKENYALASDLAKSALRAQAINARALRILGVSLGAERSGASTRNLIDLSSRVSRRDMSARVWRIQDAAASDNVAAALQEFDIALRMNSDGQRILFPILDKALSDAGIRKDFVKYLRLSPPWLAPFLDYVVDNGTSVVELAQAVQLQRPLLKPEFLQALDSRLLARLAEKQDFSEMRRYFETKPGVDRTIMISPALTSNAVDAKFSPIAWQLNESPDWSGAFDKQSSNSIALQFSVSPRARGVIAQKILFLPKGQYSIRAKYRYLVRAVGSYASLILGCKIGSADMVVFSRALNGVDVISGEPIEFAIQDGCAAQYLSIEGVGSSEQVDSSFSVDRLDLEAM